MTPGDALLTVVPKVRVEIVPTEDDSREVVALRWLLEKAKAKRQRKEPEAA